MHLATNIYNTQLLQASLATNQKPQVTIAVLIKPNLLSVFNFLLFVVLSMFCVCFQTSMLSRVQWMDYMCRLGLLGNSSTASWSNDPGGTVGLGYSLAVGPKYFIIFLLFLGYAFFLCFFVFFQPSCSHAEVFGITFLHEFHIFYSRTEGNLFLLFCKNSG